MGGSVCSLLAVCESCKVKGLADEQSLFSQKLPMEIRIKVSKFESLLMFQLSNGHFIFECGVVWESKCLKSVFKGS